MNNITAKLVGYTQPSEEFKEHFSDITDLVAYCARVSNPSNQHNTGTVDKLISYLLKHKHFSPFEMATVTMEITTTRDIARQLLRHRSFAFQEYSQRYADPTNDLNFVLREARYQDTKNRQNSVEFDLSNEQDRLLSEEWDRRQQTVIDLVKEHYKWASGVGIAKEQCRVILPEGLTESRLYMQGTIRSYIHYLEARKDVSTGTQKEHRVLAEKVAEAIATIFKLDKP